MWGEWLGDRILANAPTGVGADEALFGDAWVRACALGGGLL